MVFDDTDEDDDDDYSSQIQLTYINGGGYYTADQFRCADNS